MLIATCVFGFLIVLLLVGRQRQKKILHSLELTTRSLSDSTDVFEGLILFLKEDLRQQQQRENKILEETKTILGDALDVLNGGSTKELCASYNALRDAEYQVQKSYFRTFELEGAQRHSVHLSAETGDAVYGMLTGIEREHFPNHMESAAIEIFLLREDFRDASGDLSLMKDQERLAECKVFFEDCLQRLEALEIN